MCNFYFKFVYLIKDMNKALTILIISLALILPILANLDDTEYEISDEDEDPIDRLPPIFNAVQININSKNTFIKTQKEMTKVLAREEKKEIINLGNKNQKKDTLLEDTPSLNNRIKNNLKKLGNILKSNKLKGGNDKESEKEKALRDFIMKQVMELEGHEKSRQKLV